jgi:uncharacterized membrane-anchored protein YhcB (DUF1043 family)
MFPRKVCQSGSFNRWTTSRPILSIQLNCVRFKLQDSSSDSQSNLDQRKEERELLAAEQALLAAVSSKYSKCRQARPVLRRPAPALLRRRSNSVTPMDGLWTSSNDKADPKSLPGPARLYCLRHTGIFQTQALLQSHRRRLCPLHSHRPPLKSRAVPPSVSSAECSATSAVPSPASPTISALRRNMSRLGPAT